MKVSTSITLSDDCQMPDQSNGNPYDVFLDDQELNTLFLLFNLKDEYEFHSSDEHKQLYSPSQASQAIQKDSEAQGAILSVTSEQEMNEEQNESTMVTQVSSCLYTDVPMAQPTFNQEDSDSDHSQPQEGPNEVTVKKEKKKAAKRKNNNNNAHKPYITILNDCLKDGQMLKIIKKDLKEAKMKFNTGSRYSFITRLIDIKELFGQWILHQILATYCQVIQRFALPQNPTPSQSLLSSLILPYKECCELFSQGKEIDAVSRIYEIQGAKEKNYKLGGIKKVKEYRSKRFPKIFGAANQTLIAGFHYLN